MNQNINETNETFVTKKTPIISIAIDQINNSYELTIKKSKNAISIIRKLPGNANLFLREIFAKLNEIAAKHTMNSFQIFNNEPIFNLCAPTPNFSKWVIIYYKMFPSRLPIHPSSSKMTTKNANY